MAFNRHRLAHIFFMVLFFVCLGITTEVFFTAFTALFTGQALCGKPLASMAGVTYVWMAPVYALIPLLSMLIHPRIKHIPAIPRILIYVAVIYIIEFTSGYLLQCITGRCPWQYTSGWQVMGLIRLDYFPAWFVFAWVVERLYVFVNSRVIQ